MATSMYTILGVCLLCMSLATYLNYKLFSVNILSLTNTLVLCGHSSVVITFKMLNEIIFFTLNFEFCVQYGIVLSYILCAFLHDELSTPRPLDETLKLITFTNTTYIPGFIHFLINSLHTFCITSLLVHHIPVFSCIKAVNLCII